jgi:2-dehydropantoate 2-reductase
MRIVILGPGALGGVLGAALDRAGHDVTFLGRPSAHLDALRASGLRLELLDATEAVLPIAATDDPSIVAGADLVIVLVKAHDTAVAARGIAPHVHPGQTILTLQNGLGNAERICAAVGRGPRVLCGVTSQAATRLAPGTVRHTGEGPTVIGYWSQDEAEAASGLAVMFTAAGLPTAAVSEIAPWIWRKLAVNAAINGLTALAGVRNGMIAADPALLDAAEIVAEEVAAVARALGWELGGMGEAVKETVRTTAGNRSSMLQDLDAGRPTEVGAIHEAVLTAGREVGIAAPATAVLAALIRARERGRNESADQIQAEGNGTGAG